MSIVTAPQSIRSNNLIFYKKANVAEVLNFSNNNGLFSSMFSEKFILDFFYGILLSVSVREWIMNLKEYKSLLYSSVKKTKSPCILGHSYIKYCPDKIFVHLNYFLDFRSFSSPNIKDLQFSVMKAARRLSKILGISVSVVHCNYYSSFIKHVISNRNPVWRKVAKKNNSLNFDSLNTAFFISKANSIYNHFYKTRMPWSHEEEFVEFEL